ncbi:MAG: AraC family transcriptional regulator [Cyanobacteria bacterium P01_A01_bin.123]
MSLDLTTRDIDAIAAEAEQYCPPVTSVDQLETTYTEPPKLGSGHTREIELCPGLELSIFDFVRHDLTERVSVNEHLVQFVAFLSGTIDSGDYLGGDDLQISARQGYVGGSGIQPRHFVRFPRSHHQIGVEIHMTPALFQQFFTNANRDLPATLQPLVRGHDWQYRFSPRMTGAMRTVVQQIIDCPFLGAPKRLYLQGKVFELMALQLDGISNTVPPPPSLKSDTVARIHYAAEILRSHLETPPAQTELAHQVGIAHCTLHKGFREVFNMTPFAYLTRHRMEQAERLLRQPDATVAAVANCVGYANPAQFAAAFKRHFGITPRECMRGTVSR